MAVFKRKIDKALDVWRESPMRQPMMLRGARQVGKSFAVREFAKASYENFFEVNFEQRPSFKKIFEGDLDPVVILSELSLIFGKQIRPGVDLIFFDEIQECPQAIVSLRYFYEQAYEYHIVTAGSLLEFALEKISTPVGRIAYDFMYPLSFSEFLSATNREHLVTHLPRLRGGKIEPTSATAHALLTTAMKDYFIIGGMPAAVRAFGESRDFIAVAEVQDRILQSFRDDVHKYARGEFQSSNLEKLLETGVRHVGKQIKYTTISPDTDIRRTKASINLLEKSCLLHKIRSVNPSGLPLGAEASDKYFKLQFLDIGLGQRWAGFSAAAVNAGKDLLALYEGRLAEQFVGQQLLAESSVGSENRSLYCWIRAEKNSEAEVDFIIAREGVIIAVEIKSGTSGKLKSLKAMREKYAAVSQSVCLQQCSNVEENQGVLFMPLYSIL